LTTSENDLIRRAQTGDTEAFCELAKGYQRRLYLLALHYCRQREDAEDLSQEVWLKAFRAIGKFRGESGFYTWLRQIAINAFLNHQREKTVMRGDERTNIEWEELETSGDGFALEASLALDGENGMHQQLLVARVMDALGKLTPQHRLMFLLKHRDGMTYEEISREFGCSTGAIKKSLFRAVVKLRQHLGINVGTTDYAPLAANEKG
jgi:RNA polymerase sigma-70 factor (ECF subfamily)